MSAHPSTAKPPAAPAQGRLATNALANVAGLTITSAAALWFTPYLIRNLGVGAYGLVPLCATLGSAVGLLALGLNTATARNIIISLGRQNDREVCRVFNTALIGAAAAACCLTAVGIAVSVRLESFVSVPSGHESEFRCLFMCSVAMVAIAGLTSPFEVASVSRNRFDLRNAVNVAGTLTRIGAVVALFALMRPHVWMVGVGLVASAVVSLGGSVWVWRALMPGVRLRPGSFDAGVLKGLLSTGVWVVANQTGMLLYAGADLVVVNRVLGAVAGGGYGAVMQWSLLLRNACGLVAGVLGPSMLLRYARDDTEGLVWYALRSSALLGLLIAPAAGLVCGLSGPLVRAWLGSGYEPLVPVLAVMTAYLPACLAFLPLTHVQTAANRLAWPAAATCGIGLANVALAVVLAGRAGLGLYGVALAGGIALTARSLVFGPIYTASIVGAPVGPFFREGARVAGATAAVALGAWCLSLILPLKGWGGVIVPAGIVSAGYAALAYYVVLSDEERGIVAGILHFRGTREI